jgi:hypothetical protein
MHVVRLRFTDRKDCSEGRKERRSVRRNSVLGTSLFGERVED